MRYIKASPDDHKGSFPIAIIVSRFNPDITYELEQGALKRLKECGFTEQDITVVEVPGAGEIPLIVKCLAKKKQYGVIIALGAIIRGETTHYESVCQRVTDGCLQVSLEYEIPVILNVLTTEDEAQAWDRLGGKHGHKGVDAVDCALAMHSILQQC